MRRAHTRRLLCAALDRALENMVMPERSGIGEIVHGLDRGNG